MSLKLDNWWLVVFLFVLMIPQLMTVTRLIVMRYSLEK